jgi:hypothetical protein
MYSILTIHRFVMVVGDTLEVPVVHLTSHTEAWTRYTAPYDWVIDELESVMVADFHPAEYIPEGNAIGRLHLVRYGPSEWLRSMADKYADMDRLYKLHDQFTQGTNPYDKPAPYDGRFGHIYFRSSVCKWPGFEDRPKSIPDNASFAGTYFQVQPSFTPE